MIFFVSFYAIADPTQFFKFSFHFSNLVSFFRFIFQFLVSRPRLSRPRVCPSRQSKIIFRKISAIRLKMVCCMPLSSHRKVPYSKERQRLHAFCHGVPRGFFRACKALDWGRNHASLDSIAGATGRLQENYASSNCAHR